MAHAWQGNVRELSNVLERTLSTMKGDVIDITDLPLPLKGHAAPQPVGARPMPIRYIQADAEKKAIQAALKQTGYNKVQAASLLGIHRTLLYKKMKKHAIPLKPANGM